MAAPQRAGSSEARTPARVSCTGGRDLPRPGLEPVSPAQVGGFFASEPAGKPRVHFLNLSVSPISKRPLENRNILL